LLQRSATSVISAGQLQELTASERDGTEAILQTNSITAGDELN
jgi:hypothetical protein